MNKPGKASPWLKRLRSLWDLLVIVSAAAMIYGVYQWSIGAAYITGSVWLLIVWYLFETIDEEPDETSRRP